MKKIFYIVPVIVLLLASCGNPSPETVSTEFYEALKAKDTELLKTLSTTASHEKLSYVQDGASFIIGKGNLTKVECITIDNEQECDCWFEGKDDPISTVLVQENDLWKVDVNSTMKGMDGTGILDLIKGNSSVGGLLLDAFSGEGNLNKIVEGVSKQISDGSIDINKILEGIDPDDIASSLNGMDTSITKTLKLLEEKGVNIEEALKKIQEAQKK